MDVRRRHAGLGGPQRPDVDARPQAQHVQALAAASGVSVASIKFYQREGLLAPGDPSRPHRAYYDGSHVRRLGVIRALREVGGLSIDVIRRSLAAVDAPRADAVDAIAPAIDALAVAREAPPVDSQLARARRDVATLFTRQRLEVRKEAGSRETIARSVAALRRLGLEVDIEELVPYADAMRALAEQEIASERARGLLLGDKEGALEISILGTVLYEPIFVALRRAFHEHFSTRLVRGPRRGAGTATKAGKRGRVR